jgi:hypothetical protein
MYFLHDLDLKNGTLRDIESTDDPRVDYDMRSVKTQGRKTLQEANPPASSEPDAAYPYGKCPTWTTIAQAIESAPNVLMRSWTWQETWGSHYIAARLFVQMTVDLLLTLTSDTLLTPVPHPGSLEDAMQTWTVTAIQELFMQPQFTASNAKIIGGKGKRHVSFEAMVEIFFPHPEKQLSRNSVWRPLAEKGYIREFHRRAESLSAERLHHLTNALANLFSNVQCLPPAQACGSGRKTGRIWQARKGMVEILTNSRFYRLVRIGKSTEQRQSTARVKASNAVVAARLDEEHRGIPYNRGRQQYLLAHAAPQTGKPH